MSTEHKAANSYVQVGKSGLWVYRVGLGTMQFGWSADEAMSGRILDTYVERGGNFIDTADCYSSWAPPMNGVVNAGGVSEEIIGRWLKGRNRYDIVLATKARAAMGEMFSDHRGSFRQREGLSRRWIMQACEDSLRRLNTDYIDLYQTHFIDPLVPIEETLSTLTDLVRQGKVRYIGCSNYSAWRLMQSLWVADKHHFEHFISIQPEYSLVSPIRADFETELAQVCSHYQLGVIPYSPLAGGLLTGKYRQGQPLPDSVRADGNAQGRFSPQNWAIIEKVIEIATQTNAKPAQVALAWLRAKPWVTAPIVGANTPEQLSELLAGLDYQLSAAHLAELDEVSNFPRPRTHLEQ
ncbi:aldo/keto reductase [Thiofilum flexile]|uniref:aldo/keto reductase n=1 Tax=Thiofilum flexile TaxID=125627 RepID=UPI00035CDFFB|nr:aldo/keto reductase [Thiofilum flexile]